MTVYARVSLKLSRWLKEKNVTDDQWLTWLLREPGTVDFNAIADELQEAATAGEALMSPILDTERYIFDDVERLDYFVEKRKLFPTSRPKYYASSPLISKFISKWFEMIDAENQSIGMSGDQDP